jgi:hypothetical protein
MEIQELKTMTKYLNIDVDSNSEAVKARARIPPPYGPP